MSKFTITKTPLPMPPENDIEIVGKFLFGFIRGASDEDNKAWKKLWKKIINLEVGEIAFVEFVFPRNYKFHKKFFALLDVGYDAWEPNRVRKSYKGRPMEKNREQFREDIIIRAGYYVQTFDIDGKMTLRAQSISFAKMDDLKFEALYQATITVLLRDVCEQYKNRDELDALVDQVMGFAN